MEHLGLESLGDDFIVPYYGNEYTSTSNFHQFPAFQGWSLDASTYTLTDLYGRGAATFMQSWLYFGLIAAVVYDDNNRPSFQPMTLVTADGTSICSKNLAVILEEWQSWEKDVQNASGRKLRMIRAQLALDVAQRVVRRHFSYEGEGVYRPAHDLQLDRNLALSFMILGETLTSAKAKIIHQLDIDVRGWDGDAIGGWGTPLAVLNRMEMNNWCPRTVKILPAQLKENATALLCVFASHSGYKFQGHKEAGCTQKWCLARSENDRGEYITKHRPTCLYDLKYPSHPESPGHGSEDVGMGWAEREHTLPTCYSPFPDMIGPDIKEVASIIHGGGIPLIKFSRRTSRRYDFELEVVDGARYKEYATISHVWSDGYGNMRENKLWRCQIAYILELLMEAQVQMGRRRGASWTEPLPVWIDTLTVPVQMEYRAERRKTIRRIYDIYSKASYTIVIDNGLNSMAWTDDYATTAMRILASGWMRRLWTLQEAYLSRKLFFALKPYDGGPPLVDLDRLEESFFRVNEELMSNLVVNARNYYHNMLGESRIARIHNFTSPNSVDLIASVWRAAQWRTTTHVEHEPLALATLLGLDYGYTVLGSAELLKVEDGKEDKRDEMMKQFWILLEENLPRCIPSGIIFLPGDKVRKPAFGWAPRTWMLAPGVDTQDTVSMISKPGTLLPHRGLMVEFPGFLLHSQDSRAILGDTYGEGFWFPSDNSLSEWYHVCGADANQYDGSDTFREQRGEELAVILCRTQPRKIDEIGLLVEIHQKIEQRELGERNVRRIFAVYVLSRVHVRRETNVNQWERKRIEMLENQRDESRTRIICGVALDENQKWYVDRRVPAVEERSRKWVKAIRPTVFLPHRRNHTGKNLEPTQSVTEAPAPEHQYQDTEKSIEIT